MKKSSIILLTHTDLDGYGNRLVLEAFGLKAKTVHLEVNKIDGYVLEMIRRVEAGEMEQPKYVFITDLGLKPETAKAVDEWLKSKEKDSRPIVRLFDHHPSALHLNEYDWAAVVVRDEAPKACGTSLFYEYLKDYLGLILPADKTERLEWLVELIRLYDVWEWQEKDALSAQYLNTLFYLFGGNEFIKRRLEWLDTGSDILLSKEEKLLLQTEERRITRYLKEKEREMVVIDDFFKSDDGYYKVGVVQADNYFSELGDHLCNKYENLDFVVMFKLTYNKVSFRARDPKIDLLPVVRSFGGGGHPHAAGCSFEALGMEFLERVFSKTVA